VHVIQINNIVIYHYVCFHWDLILVNSISEKEVTVMASTTMFIGWSSVSIDILLQREHLRHKRLFIENLIIFYLNLIWTNTPMFVSFIRFGRWCESKVKYYWPFSWSWTKVCFFGFVFGEGDQSMVKYSKTWFCDFSGYSKSLT